jgi:hypothetical protein
MWSRHSVHCTDLEWAMTFLRQMLQEGLGLAILVAWVSLEFSACAPNWGWGVFRKNEIVVWWFLQWTYYLYREYDGWRIGCSCLPSLWHLLGRSNLSIIFDGITVGCRGTQWMEKNLRLDIHNRSMVTHMI